MMVKDKGEVVVIGSGPAGYVASIRAAQLGGEVILIEKDKLGGVCLNVGCIPTKTLVQSVELASLIRRAKQFGLKVENFSPDLAQIMERKRKIVNQLVRGVEYLIKKNKVNLIKGRATIADSSRVIVETEEGDYQIKAKNIIITTGSSPANLPLEKIDTEDTLTSNEALDLKEIPKDLLIVGGGVIGLEFAHIYGGLGTKISIVEMLSNILPGEDREVSKKLQQILTKKGLSVFTGSVVKSIERNKGNYTAWINTPGGGKKIPLEKILICIGRVPNSTGIGLEKAGVKVDKKGWIKVNAQMQTNISNVYAAGDVIGGYCLAHVAQREGEIAAENAMGQPSDINYRSVPRFVCSSPEVASVGLSEEEAHQKGYLIKVGRFPFVGNGKALVLGESEGFVKIISDAKSEEILGVHIIGPQATNLIAEATLAINLECTLNEIIDTIHAHPTLSEVLREASLGAKGRAIHI